MITIPVIDAAEAASWDEAARTAAAIPSRVLMESAGRAVVTVLSTAYRRRLRGGILVVAGHGNNGGDGWVAARALRAAGVTVWVVDEDRRRSPDCEANRELALAAGVERVQPGDQWPQAALAVDALLGTGASGPPRGTVATLAHRLAQLPCPIIAVDGPTGLDLSTGEAHDPVAAELTVTFGGVRRGHLLARRWCGTIAVVDIGFPPPPPDARWPTLVERRWAQAALPVFQPDMHKGERGRLLVVGGNQGMAGAAHYAAASAFAAGAGLVKLASHSTTVEALQSSFPDALTVSTKFGSTLESELVEALDWANAFIVGPGLGRGDERAAFVGALLGSTNKPAVIDADALHTGDALQQGDGAGHVLTPHEGEFRAAFPSLSRMVAEDRFAAARAAQAISGGTVLLKGVPTVIADDSGTKVVATGNPGLATGGSGDVLSGLIGAFLARGMAGGDAAALASYAMGRAAELAVERRTARATRPGDVISQLPHVWRTLSQPVDSNPPVLVELAPPEVV